MMAVAKTNIKYLMIPLIMAKRRTKGLVMDTKLFLKALLQTSAITAVAVGTAFAQDNDSDATEANEVIVTGSRIKSDTFTSPVAIDVLTVEDAKIEGIADLGGLLQTSTAASGSSQITSAVSAAFVSDGGLGAESVGLRGLAANRTLDLINGRRAGPSGVRGSINTFDLNSIPLAGIERVDILKDGASSIYGSDAIAGVINYITNKSDGGEIDAYTSISEESGGEQYRLSGSWGQTFDKGRFRVTGDYFKEEELNRGSRDYLDCDEAYAFSPDTGGRIDVVDPRTGDYQCRDLIWGHIWIYDYSGNNNTPDSFPNIAQYDYDGSLASNGLPGYIQNAGGGVEAPAGWFPIYYDQADIAGNPTFAGYDVGDRARGLVNYDHPFQDEETLSPSTERYTFMFDGDYEINSNITAYGEALFNRRVTKSNGYRQYWNYSYGETSFGGDGTLGTNDSGAGWGGDAWFSPTAITDINDSKTEIDYMRFVGGIKGELGEDALLPGWSWDVYAQHSDSSGKYTNDQIYNDSIRNYNFSTGSCATINGGMTTGATGNGVTVDGRPCVDVPWFSADLMNGVMSPEVRDFLFFETTGKTDYTQTTIEGFISGDLIKAPAGDIAAAVGVFYQRDEINDVPDDHVLAGNVWGSSSAGITAGSQSSKAIYGELAVPLAKGATFFESLSATLSGRYTEIETVTLSGESEKTDGFNYRATVDWQTIPSVRLRASTGTSFRAPGLFEQFLGNETSFSSQRSIDPCFQWGDGLSSGAITQRVADNCAADGVRDDHRPAISADVFRGGGFGVLVPETSRNYTFGGVWTPDFADLSVALDYFDITIKDEISTLSASAIVGGCYASENFSTEPLCNFFNRNPPGPGADDSRITDVTATFINVNRQENRGLDLTVRYGQDTQFGRLEINAQATHQLESRGLLLADDSVEDFNGELGEPKTTGFLNVTLQPSDAWRVRWSVNHIGRTSNNMRADRNDPSPTLYGVPAKYKNFTESTTYHGISGEYSLDGGWTFRAGINNLFDEHPPAISSGDTGNVPIRSQYDYLGRTGFLNVTKTFN